MNEWLAVATRWRLTQRLHNRTDFALALKKGATAQTVRWPPKDGQPSPAVEVKPTQTFIARTGRGAAAGGVPQRGLLAKTVTVLWQRMLSTFHERRLTFELSRAVRRRLE